MGKVADVNPLLVVTNSSAGSSEEEALSQAVNVLRTHADVEVASTSNPGELDGVLQRAGSRTIVAAGGDGSLHALVASLHRRNELGKPQRKRLGLIPLGTGNDFARTLELPLAPEEAAEVIVAGHARPMDILLDELGSVVVNNVHAGASAQASRRGARWKKRLNKAKLGILGYPIGAAISAVSPPFVRVRVEVDRKVVCDLDRHVLMVAVGNGASVGGGTEVTPGADPEDGKADVMVSFATGPLARVAYVADLVRGKHESRDDVLTLRGTEVTVTGEEFYISADGEITGPERRRSWRVEPAAYDMIVPKPAAHPTHVD